MLTVENKSSAKKPGKVNIIIDARQISWLHQQSGEVSWPQLDWTDLGHNPFGPDDCDAYVYDM